MDKNWGVSAMVKLPGGKADYVDAYGPAPRIYEALGFAKEAIAKKYPKDGGENVEITCAKTWGHTGAKEWHVELCYSGFWAEKQKEAEMEGDHGKM